VKPLVHVETSVISYLTARTSSHLVTAARQAWTSEIGVHIPLLTTPEELMES
jgi:hypothetical protein